MIILLYGCDNFRSFQKLQEIKDKFIKDVDPSKLNIDILEGQKLSINDCTKAINTTPFLAKRRFIIFKNILSTSKDKELLKQLSELIKEHQLKKDIETTNALVFYEQQEALGRSGLAKLLKGIEHSYKFDSLQGFALNKWIKQEVKKQNSSIDEDAIKELASLVGNDLWVLHNEISKLSAFSKDKKITKSDVCKLVLGKFDDNIFNLVDAVGIRDKRTALKLINEQLASGAHEFYILSMLIRQYRILLGVKDMVNLGKTKKEISLFLGIHPFVAQKSIQQIRNYSLDQLKNIYRLLTDIDLKLKRGLSPQVLFEVFICKI